jgi:hypothetical protein
VNSILSRRNFVGKLKQAALLATILLVGCSQVDIVPAESPTLPSISTPTSTVTPTLEPTETTTPTITPTETPIPIDEQDLESHYTLEIDEIVFGANITGSLSSDESLAVSNPRITGFSLSKGAAALYLTMVIHEVFEHQNPGISYNDYMRMIADLQEAVKNNGAVDPSNIALILYANDKMDGNGYMQQQYYIIPWYGGPSPEEINGIPVRAIKNIDVHLVRASRVDNMTIINEGFDIAFGTNLNNDRLELYVPLSYGSAGFPANSRSTAYQLASLPWWLINNEGKDMNRSKAPPENDKLYDFLRASGFAVIPPRP